MLENFEGTITNGQSRETGNIGHTRHRTKTNKNQQHKNTLQISYDCGNKTENYFLIMNVQYAVGNDLSIINTYEPILRQ